MIRFVDETPMPVSVARLPRNAVGWPIPWFVPTIGGVRDIRIASADLMVKATRERLCWICGERLGRLVACVIGPMCTVNRLSSEPPQHPDCAVYAARVCPFLVRPQMRRREGGKPDGMIAPAGHMVKRNPGVSAVWSTKTVTPFRSPAGGDGLLFELGDPSSVAWFREGRPATRDEVVAALDEGMPALDAVCDLDEDPAQSRRDLQGWVDKAMLLVPV